MQSARSFLPLTPSYRNQWNDYLDSNPVVEQMFEAMLPSVEADLIVLRTMPATQPLTEGIWDAITDLVGNPLKLTKTAEMINRFADFSAEKIGMPKDAVLLRVVKALSKTIENMGVPMGMLLAFMKWMGFESNTIGGTIATICILYLLYQYLKQKPEEAKTGKDKVEMKAAAQEAKPDAPAVASAVKQVVGGEAGKPLQTGGTAPSTGVVTASLYVPLDRYLRETRGCTVDHLFADFSAAYGRTEAARRVDRLNRIVAARTQ